ncbi:MAG: MBL fold metallo-hydrolase [Deltaproteobacteria bacterium]|nr:MBL fold metallo-hydrolase [Deltaproteobacteria bacterium]
MTPGREIHLGGKLWFIAGANQGRFPRAHAIVVRDRVTALIDAGLGRDLLAGLAGQVDLVLCTHAHLDHTWGNHLLPGATITAPRGSAETFGHLDRLRQRFIPDAAMGRAWRTWITTLVPWQDRSADDFYEPYQEFDLGSTRLVAFPAPGHNADFHCFWFPVERVLYSGDLDLTPFGPWYGNPESDLREFRDSVARAADLGPRVVVSSHFPPQHQEAAAQLRAWGGHFTQRSDKLLALLAQPRTLGEIVEAALIYGRFPHQREMLMHFEKVMISEHLAELVELGRVRDEGGVFRVV